MEPPVLETENLVKVYGRGANRFDALKGLTLEIKRGESVAVIGKSGSGKSTLMHLMALLDRPSQGVVALNGRPVSELKNKEIHKVRNESFGFVFQQFFLNPNQTVLENVVLPLKIAGLSKRERNQRGMEALERLEMADKAKNKATDLSGGQKQRACIARALVTNPSVIFADEPTGNLDSNTSEVVEEILFGLQRECGITLVVVTHDDDLAAKCDRRIHLKDGEIVSVEEGRLDATHGEPNQQSASSAGDAVPAPNYRATEPWAATGGSTSSASEDGPKHREEGTR
ncbi:MULTISPECIES: ABC transporter ATP-binding protein [Kocuria]|uniref:ABC transporter ATP-binding protein n=1 Tax=Kocuria subflava TaxID=1736139 RepID=A0A846U128_9MICC|nr:MULTISPECIES: ABC transporter ATP-binding protein [Kocuria]NKE08421.1 ABC transporter ATP-binding protein [Kocuria subflava]